MYTPHHRGLCTRRSCRDCDRRVCRCSGLGKQNCLASALAGQLPRRRNSLGHGHGPLERMIRARQGQQGQQRLQRMAAEDENERDDES